MRENLKLALALAAGVTLALPGLALARHHHRSMDDSSDASSADSTPSTDTAPGLAPSGWGVGAGFLQGMDALSATYRINPKWSVDGLLLASGSSYYDGGTSASGGNVNAGSSTFGIGAQGRYNLLQPSRFLNFQLVGNLSYLTGSHTSTIAGNPITSSSGTFEAFLGAGFEGFVPFWPSVSLEVNSGLRLDAGSTNPGNSTSYGTSSFNLGTGAGFVPLNLAVHYYF